MKWKHEVNHVCSSWRIFRNWYPTDFTTKGSAPMDPPCSEISLQYLNDICAFWPCQTRHANPTQMLEYWPHPIVISSGHWALEIVRTRSQWCSIKPEALGLCNKTPWIRPPGSSRPICLTGIGLSGVRPGGRWEHIRCPTSMNIAWIEAYDNIVYTSFLRMVRCTRWN
jgi:hypothetical protein